MELYAVQEKMGATHLKVAFTHCVLSKRKNFISAEKYAFKMKYMRLRRLSLMCYSILNGVTLLFFPFLLTLVIPPPPHSTVSLSLSRQLCICDLFSQIAFKIHYF